MLGEAFNEWAGVFSPDMRWVAYVSTGAAGIYVRPFRVSEQTGQPSISESKWQITNRGNWPQWRLNREIVFNTAPNGTAVFAAVNTAATAFESGAPQRLPLSSEHGVDATPQSASRRPALLDRSAVESLGTAEVNQRGSQLAGVVEAMKPTASTIAREFAVDLAWSPGITAG